MYDNKVLEAAAVHKTTQPESPRRFTIVGMLSNPQIVEVELTGDIVDELNWCIEVNGHDDIPVGFGVADCDLYDTREEALKAVCQAQYSTSLLNYADRRSLANAVQTVNQMNDESAAPKLG